MMTLPKPRFLLTLIVVVLAVSVWAQANQITVTDQFDRTVEIDGTPLRIVSGSPSNTELLLDLGLADRIVGVTNWCGYSEVADTTRVGDINPLNLETILTLQPDVVVAHNLNGREIVDQLHGFGVPVLAIRAATLDSLMDSVALVGEVTGTSERAEALRAEMIRKRQAIEEAAEEIRQKNLKVLFVVHVEEPIWTSGPGSFIDEAIVLAGGINVAGDASSTWVQMDAEAILQRNPDVIMLGGDPALFTDNPRWQTLAAVQKGQVYSINTDAYNRATPSLFDSILEMVELFKNSH